MRVNIGGKNWDLVWHHFGRSDLDGDCDPPHKKGKQIRLRKTLLHPRHAKVLLEQTIHEMLHASDWNLDEELVRQYAKDTARLLWKLGFRRLDS